MSKSLVPCLTLAVLEDHGPCAGGGLGVECGGCLHGYMHLVECQGFQKCLKVATLRIITRICAQHTHGSLQRACSSGIIPAACGAHLSSRSIGHHRTCACGMQHAAAIGHATAKPLSFLQHLSSDGFQHSSKFFAG